MRQLSFVKTAEDKEGIQLYCHVNFAFPCLYLARNNSNMPKHTSLNRARAKKVFHTLAWNGALTLVKQFGLCVSDVCGHSMDSLVCVSSPLNIFPFVILTATRENVDILYTV